MCSAYAEIAKVTLGIHHPRARLGRRKFDFDRRPRIPGLGPIFLPDLRLESRLQAVRHDRLPTGKNRLKAGIQQAPTAV
jgi:hypothetical protein